MKLDLSAGGVRLPLWEPQGPDSLVHIGTMNATDKGTSSYEGHGLSVSECPDSWEEIARLGGNPWWRLERDGAVFLDWHRVPAAAMKALLGWGVQNGLCEPCDGHVLTYTDLERGDRRTMMFDTLAAAQGEFDMASENEGSEPGLSMRKAWRLSDQGRRLVNRTATDLSETETFVTLLWIERETSLDGMYWDDEHSPEHLSAPRAVILPARLAAWGITTVPGRETPQRRRQQQR